MKLKMTVLTAALVFGLNISTATAQWAVYDAANHTESIMQYMQLVEQLKNMQAQLEQAKEQYKAITGARGMGSIQTGTDGKNLPTSWQELLAATGGNGDLKRLADDIRSKSALLKISTIKGMSEAAKKAETDNQDAVINEAAANTAVYEESNKRFDRLKILMDKIETAADLKAIADLQARIQVETVMLQNEAIRIQSMNAIFQSQQKIREQKSHESTKLDFEKVFEKQRTNNE